MQVCTSTSSLRYSVTHACSKGSRAASLLPIHPRQHQRSGAILMLAKRRDDDELESDSIVSTLVATGTQLVDSVADMVPASVPRPAAKGVVAVVGGLMLMGLVKQVVSSALTLGLVGAAAYYYLSRSGGDDGGDDNNGQSKGSSKRSKRSKSRQDDDDLDDPLAEARRIIDKYR